MTPLVIGHRGAPGYRPEHTLAAYELAARQGADFIEPDLVITGDGVLVARHEPEISTTTDVAEHPEFADRERTKSLDGMRLRGWWAEDFTVAELKTLRARERIPSLRPGNAAYDGRFEIPTLQEVLDLRERLSAQLGRAIGVYPETKHPAYFRAAGLPLEEPLVEALRGDGSGPVLVQSFEPRSLRLLAGELDAPLVQLFGRGSSPDAVVLERVAEYAAGVGPPKDWIVPRGPDGRSLPPTAFVDETHAAGLFVHAWTFRAENGFLPLELRSSEDPAALGDHAAEVRQFLELGVDGLFVDQPDLAVAACGA